MREILRWIVVGMVVGLVGAFALRAQGVVVCRNSVSAYVERVKLTLVEKKGSSPVVNVSAYTGYVIPETILLKDGELIKLADLRKFHGKLVTVRLSILIDNGNCEPKLLGTFGKLEGLTH